MEKKEFLLLLDELFELEPGTISDDDVLEDVPGWSSLTFIGLIALVDDHLQTPLRPSAILGCHTVGDFVGLLGDKISRPVPAA